MTGSPQLPNELDGAHDPGALDQTWRVIDSFAQRCWPVLDAGGVVSPVGAWLLLALAAGAGRGDGVPSALGLELPQAHARAVELLAAPPRALRAAVALWVNAAQRTEAFQAWEQTLTEGLAQTLGPGATGGIPTSAEADAWAARATDGVVSRFPVSVGPATSLVLANAVATDVRWRKPYRLDEVQDWGTGGPWQGLISTVLLGDDLGALGSELGLHPVHHARADGLDVVCVGMPDASIEAARGLSSTAPLVRQVLVDGGEDLWSLPLGQHGPWLIREEPLPDAPASRVLRTQVRMPAWEVSTDWDLMADPDLGVQWAAAQVNELLANPGPAQAAQGARARFDRLGFTAAAVSALAIMRSAPPREQLLQAGVLRTVRADLSTPFAVFAFIDQPESAWHQCLAFAAWVHLPADPQQVDST